MFFWEIDEFMILAISLSFGILIGGIYTVVGLGLGFYLVNLFRRYKDNGLPGQLNHLFHWNNWINLNKYFPKGGERRVFK